MVRRQTIVLKDWDASAGICRDQTVRLSILHYFQWRWLSCHLVVINGFYLVAVHRRWWHDLALGPLSRWTLALCSLCYHHRRLLSCMLTTLISRSDRRVLVISPHQSFCSCDDCLLLGHRCCNIRLHCLWLLLLLVEGLVTSGQILLLSLANC